MKRAILVVAIFVCCTSWSGDKIKTSDEILSQWKSPAKNVEEKPGEVNSRQLKFPDKDDERPGRSIQIDILFATNSAEVGQEWKVQLAEMAKAMKHVLRETRERQLKFSDPNEPSRTELSVLSDNFYVYGHTDAEGSEAYNLDLSTRRANSVAAYLVELGVPESSIHAHGVGESHPIASNETPEGRAQNRRVEFILEPAQHE